MAQPYTETQNQSPGPTDGEIRTAVKSLRHAHPDMGKKKLLALLNVDNDWKITSKDFRQHIKTIETEEKHSNEDPVAAIEAEKGRSGGFASSEEAAAIRAVLSTIKQIEATVTKLEAAILAAKKAPTVAIFKGGLLQQQQNDTEDLKGQLRALRTAAIPRVIKEYITQLNADEGWATDSWAFEILRNVMAVCKTSLDSFRGPLIIALPPSAAAAQRLAKQHNLSVRGWSTHLGTTDAMWCDPEVDSQELHSIPVPSRSDVPRFPNVAKKDTRGQQLTYLLVLLATFTIEWPEVAKVFNKIWCQPDIRAVFSVKRRFVGASPYDEICEEELRKMWEEQTMYGQDLKAMRLAMESIDCEKQVKIVFIDENGEAHALPGSPMLTIESRAEDAGVVLVKREVAPVQPQTWASIRALIASSQSLRDAIEKL